MNRRDAIKKAGWVFTGLIFVPKLIRAQGILDADDAAEIGYQKRHSHGVTLNGCATAATGMSGLLSYWQFDENAGTTAADANSRAPGTLVGTPAWSATSSVPGKVGASCLTFTARTQYVTTAVAVASLTQMTMCAWVKGSNFAGAGGHNMILSEDGNNCWLEVTSASKLNFHSQHNDDYVGTTTLSTGTWYHLAATIDSGNGATGNVKTYINGVQEASSATALGQTRTNIKIFISTYGAGVGTLGFIGSLDEVCVFNRALTSTEIGVLAGCS